MLRFFITAILYLISFFTQGQETSIFEQKEIKAKKVGVSVIFDEVPKGAYTITCFYDKNNNGKMDFSLKGMPLEDYGSSNNVMSFGQPGFEDTKFEVINKDLTFEIKL